MGIETIATIISGILIVVTSVFGKKFTKYKNLFNNAVGLLNEVKKAYADNKITPKELKKIIDKYEELIGTEKK